MSKKEFKYRGKTLEELKEMGQDEFIKLLPARQRRTLKRELTDAQKILLKNIKSSTKPVETHCRDMIILPEMIGKIIKVHRGNRFEEVRIQEEMLGHYLGEFVSTRHRVSHSAPGVGATRSSASISVK